MGLCHRCLSFWNVGSTPCFKCLFLSLSVDLVHCCTILSNIQWSHFTHLLPSCWLPRPPVPHFFHLYSHEHSVHPEPGHWLPPLPSLSKFQPITSSLDYPASWSLHFHSVPCSIFSPGSQHDAFKKWVISHHPLAPSPEGPPIDLRVTSNCSP